MLQLPQNAPRSPRFTKAQIADMARGGKVTVRVKSAKPKTDPIIALIAKADDALEKYVLAFNAFEIAQEQLPPEDRGWAYVTPIDELIPTLSHSDRFNNIEHIDAVFARATKSASAGMKDARMRLRKLRPGVRAYDWKLELTQRFESCRKRIATLAKYKEAQKRAFRAEERRLLKAQRTVRLNEKRLARTAAYSALLDLTKKIGKMQPVTKSGALAVLSYAGLRCRDDLAEYFVQNGRFPAELQKLIGRARSLLSKNS